MKTHITAGAAILSIVTAAGLWACSSDKPKEGETSSTETSTTTSSGYGSTSDTGSSATTTADAGMSGDDSTGATSVNRTPDLGAPSEPAPASEVAAMETSEPAADTSSTDQTQEYEKSQRK